MITKDQMGPRCCHGLEVSPWDVTVPDTYAESHISSTVVKAGAAAHRVAESKTDKYASLASTHITDSFRRDLKTFLFRSVYGHQDTD